MPFHQQNKSVIILAITQTSVKTTCYYRWYTKTHKSWKGIRGKDDVLCIDQHILKKVKTKAGKCSRGIDRLHKDVTWFVNVDNRVFEKVQDIKASRKLHHKKTEEELATGGQTLAGKNPKSHFSGRLIIATTICYSNHAA